VKTFWGDTSSFLPPGAEKPSYASFRYISEMEQDVNVKVKRDVFIVAQIAKLLRSRRGYGEKKNVILPIIFLELVKLGSSNFM